MVRCVVRGKLGNVVRVKYFSPISTIYTIIHYTTEHYQSHATNHNILLL